MVPILINKDVFEPSYNDLKFIVWNRNYICTNIMWIVNWWKWVAQSCPALCDPTDYTVHGILQARILEWVAFPFSMRSSQPRDQTQVSLIAGGFFTSWATRKVVTWTKNHLWVGADNSGVLFHWAIPLVLNSSPFKLVLSSFKLISVKHQKATQFCCTIPNCFQFSNQNIFCQDINNTECKEDIDNFYYIWIKNFDT